MSKLLNRDSLTLDFDWRVGFEGTRTRNTLESRVNFIGIALNNLREFMQVRYPSIAQETPDELKRITKQFDEAHIKISSNFMRLNRDRKLIKSMDELNKKQ
ncbi:MAG: hypothetical protein K2F99_08465, partial [Muribaculaceae bacterium]|nr:hypothetical protein [Muribaculaceae bacterium]